MGQFNIDRPPCQPSRPRRQGRSVLHDAQAHESVFDSGGIPPPVALVACHQCPGPTRADGRTISGTHLWLWLQIASDRSRSGGHWVVGPLGSREGVRGGGPIRRPNPSPGAERTRAPAPNEANRRRRPKAILRKSLAPCDLGRSIRAQARHCRIGAVGNLTLFATSLTNRHASSEGTRPHENGRRATMLGGARRGTEAVFVFGAPSPQTNLARPRPGPDGPDPTLSPPDRRGARRANCSAHRGRPAAALATREHDDGDRLRAVLRT